MIKLYPTQITALSQIKNGSVLWGGVGSGKTITSLMYYYTKVCDGEYDYISGAHIGPPKKLIPLVVITTAAIRDKADWHRTLPFFLLSTQDDSPLSVTIDSWNNIGKYKYTDAFFIFDEQHTMGGGIWSKTFIYIAKRQPWILLSATPANDWGDWKAIFLAHKFFPSQWVFEAEHAIMRPFAKYKDIIGYHNTDKLKELAASITVIMDSPTNTEYEERDVYVDYDEDAYNKVMVQRWHVYEDRPILDAAERFRVARRVINENPNKIKALRDLLAKHKRLIVFYSYDYELHLLRDAFYGRIVFAEWNGHNHDTVPESETWIYAVQYTAGGEGWNCITTDTVVFMSRNASYRTIIQARGRVDRMNTPFSKLYYYHITTHTSADKKLMHKLKQRKAHHAEIHTFAKNTSHIIDR